MSLSARKETLSWLMRLRDAGMVKCNTWPGGLISERQALQQAGIIRVATPAGKRAPHLVVANSQALESRIRRFQGDAPAEQMSVRASNLHATGSTKSGDDLPYLLLSVLPGATQWYQAGEQIPLASHPSVFTGVVLQDETDSPMPSGDVVFIENRDVWLNLRRLMPQHLAQAALIHYEGWMSKRLLGFIQQWSSARIWIIPDYDLVGFHNFMNLQAVRPDASMLIPKLSDDQIKQWGSEELWVKQKDYLYTAISWAAQSDEAAPTFLRRLSSLGFAIEQEFLTGIADLEWHGEYPWTSTSSDSFMLVSKA